MTPVYAWPPVAPFAWEWSLVEPLETSRSLLTGRRYASAGQRARRVARMSIGGIRDDFGGYMEALKRLLRGGANLVRLRNYPMVWDTIPLEIRASEPLRWTTGAESLAWQTGAEPLAWFTGTVASGAITTVDGFPAITITGLPPNTLVGRPGEPVTVWASLLSLDFNSAQARTLLRHVTSDANGIATVVLDQPVTVSGRVDLGFETAVFEANGLPRTQRTVGQQWVYDWDFTEVFSDEVGGFQEINPW
jgi:hypothetical protein